MHVYVIGLQKSSCLGACHSKKLTEFHVCFLAGAVLHDSCGKEYVEQCEVSRSCSNHSSQTTKEERRHEGRGNVSVARTFGTSWQLKSVVNVISVKRR